MKKMMKRNAFTVVELVIVIAVVAVLAAVMIPAFTGIMQSAHVSADTQRAAAMTTQITVTADEPIKTESQLKKALDAAYGDPNYFATLAPESASYGYHFWFDIENQKVVVAKPNELSGDAAAFALRGLPTWATFAPGSPRTAIKNGYYLMDRVGESGKLVDLICKVETAGDSTAYTTLIDMATEYPGLASLRDYAILTSNGAFGDSTATKLYISPFSNTIGGDGLGEYTALAGTLAIPAGVKVGPGALNSFNGNSVENPNVIVDAKTEEEILSVFLAGEAIKSDLYVQTLGGEIYHIVNNKVYRVTEVGEDDLGDLGYANNVESFEIIATGTGAAMYNGQIYIPYDQKTFTLQATNFVGIFEGEVSSKIVTWSSANPALASVDAASGTVTVQLPALGVNSQVVLTATAVAGGAQQSITLNIVRMNTAMLQTVFGDLELDNDEDPLEVTIEYTGTKEFGLGSISDWSSNYYNSTTNKDINDLISGFTCSLDFSASAGEGNVFTVDNENKKITLTTAEFGTQMLTIKVGEYITKTVAVTVVDNSKTPFEVKEIVSDRKIGQYYLFRVGNSNAFALGKLFENDKPAGGITVTISDITAKEGDAPAPAIATSGATNGSVFWADMTDLIDISASNWATQTIRFYGTGVAEIKISTNDGKFAKVVVEVVNGKNIVSGGSFTGSDNNILLENFTLASGTISIGEGKALWGNGFTLNVEAGSNNQKGIITLRKNALLDNVRVIGAVYSTFTATSYSAYSSATVDAEAGSRITNSYISGSRSPLLCEDTGTVTVENTTLEGGRYANAVVSSSTLVLKNVTTVTTLRYDKDGNGVMGFGIVIENDAPPSTGVTIIGTFTQYNFIKASDANYAPSHALVQSTVNEIFAAKHSDMQFSVVNDEGETVVYANAGILFLNNSVNIAGLPDNYLTKTISVSGNSVGLCTMSAAENTITTEDLVCDEWIPEKQGVYEPVFKIFGLPTEKGEGTTYIYYAEETIKIGTPDGTYTIEDIWNYVSLSKYSDFSIVPNVTTTCGTVTNNKSIAIAQDGVITLTFKDKVFFDENGAAITSEEVTYVYEIKVDIEKTTLPTITIEKTSFNDIQWIGLKTSLIVLDQDYAMGIIVLEGLVIKSGDTVLYDGTGKTELPAGLTIEVTSITGGGSTSDLGPFTHYKKYSNKYYYCTSFDAVGFNNPDTTSKVVVKYTYESAGYQKGEATITFSATSKNSVKKSKFQ